MENLPPLILQVENAKVYNNGIAIDEVRGYLGDQTLS